MSLSRPLEKQKTWRVSVSLAAPPILFNLRLYSVKTASSIGGIMLGNCRSFQNVVVCFVCVVACSFGSATAETDKRARNFLSDIEWTFSGQHRTRFETISPIPTVDTGRRDLISLRTSFTFEAQAGNFFIRSEVMDSRSFNPTRDNFLGDRSLSFTGIQPNNWSLFHNPFEPIQYHAGVEIDDLLVNGSSLEFLFGRYTLDIGSGRLFGRDDFRNTADSFFGWQTNWGTDEHFIQSFFAFPIAIVGGRSRSCRVFNSRFDCFSGSRYERYNGSVLDDVETDDRLWGLHYTNSVILRESNFEVYAFGSSQLPNFSVDAKNLTIGGRIHRAPNNGEFDFDIEGAVQLEIDERSEEGISFFAHAELGRSFSSAWLPRLAIVFDISSSTEFASEIQFLEFEGEIFEINSVFSVQRAFDRLYGRDDKDFGPGGIYGLFDGSEVLSAGVRFSAAPSDALDVQATFRTYHIEDNPNLEALFDEPSITAYWGSQIDGYFSHQFFDGIVEGKVGGAVFFSGDRLDTFFSSSQFNCEIFDSCRTAKPVNYFYTSLTIGF
ncbi:MAG: alginate export family protein [Pseudomonadota bacterium]